VDYGGICCNYKEIKSLAEKFRVPIIQDAAHSIGSYYSGLPVGSFSDFTIFSFQAIKTLTTGDGGLLSLRDQGMVSSAKRIRWFGIDRESKQAGVWENDIREIGYKYQMNDIAASIGLANLANLNESINYRKMLFEMYVDSLSGLSGIKVITSDTPETNNFCPWLLTVIVEKGRVELMNALRASNIESAQVHYRNDRYTIFGKRTDNCPNMDKYEDKYLVLPLHHKVNGNVIDKIKRVIAKGW